MNLSVGQRTGIGGRSTPRGSTHRTSFIEYVSEVYKGHVDRNERSSGTSGNHLGGECNLSVRGRESISSGSVISGISSNSLARDFSVRSENVSGTNRMLSFKVGTKSGGHLGSKGGLNRDTTKSARLAAGWYYLNIFNCVLYCKNIFTSGLILVNRHSIYIL